MTSIIVPAFNAEKYLPAAIGSVISQSDSDWELILVDDGSTDGTSEICDDAARKDSRIKVVHKSNGGLSDARNAGLDAASGDFIAFLDADDIIAPGFIKVLKGALVNSDASFAAAPFFYFNHFSEAALFPSESEIPRKGMILPVEEAMEKALYQTGVGGNGHVVDHSVCGKLFRKQMWDKTRFTKGIWYEDLDIFFRLWSKAKKMVFVPVPLMGYRQHPSSFIHRFSKGRLDVLDVVDRLVTDFSSSHPESEAARTRRFAAHCNIFLLLLRNGRPDRPAERRCLSVIRRERRMVLGNKKARLKDRIGALLAFSLF